MNCSHEFIHCEKCDTVTCKKCKKIWGEKEVIVQPNIQPYIPFPYQPWWGIHPPLSPQLPFITCGTADLRTHTDEMYYYNVGSQFITYTN